MSDSIKFEWQAADGYVGDKRPQYTVFSIDEITSCESVAEAMDLIEDAIREDFQQKICPSYDSEKIRKEVERLFSEKE